MVTVTVAIAQFMLMLIEAALWAAFVGTGGFLLVLLAAAAVILLLRRLVRRRRAGDPP